MPVKMVNKNSGENRKIKAQLIQEFEFLKSIFGVINLPNRDNTEDNADYEMFVDESQKKDKTETPKRARCIAELEEKLQKIKSQNNFNIKNKLAKKSLNSKLNKKLKKKERKDMRKKLIKLNKQQNETKLVVEDEKEVKKEKKTTVSQPQPVFNTEAKLVFSKIDFSNMGQSGKPQKRVKDPKKMLENLKNQEKTVKELEGNDNNSKAKEIKEKLAWKNILQKAVGEKVKDDPILLKKSIQKIEQKKKQSKKQWDNRIKSVEQLKELRQKKRKENIIKKKKEKKAKKVKAAVKRGRVVI